MRVEKINIQGVRTQQTAKRKREILKMIITYSFRFAFEMLPRRQGENGILSILFCSSSLKRRESDAGIQLRMSRSIPTQPTKEALECEMES
jgi:hypothetical protein